MTPPTVLVTLTRPELVACWDAAKEIDAAHKPSSPKERILAKNHRFYGECAEYAFCRWAGLEWSPTTMHDGRGDGGFDFMFYGGPLDVKARHWNGPLDKLKLLYPCGDVHKLNLPGLRFCWARVETRNNGKIEVPTAIELLGWCSGKTVLACPWVVAGSQPWARVDNYVIERNWLQPMELTAFAYEQRCLAGGSLRA